MDDERKGIVVKLIGERYHIINGALSKDVTKKSKEAAWKEIITKCKQQGFSPLKEGRTWEYLRDKTWPNWKQAAMTKFDKNKQTGSEGGEDAIYTKLQSAVLDVIGTHSTQAMGLPIRDQCGEIVNHSSQSLLSQPPNANRRGSRLFDFEGDASTEGQTSALLSSSIRDDYTTLHTQQQPPINLTNSEPHNLDSEPGTSSKRAPIAAKRRDRPLSSDDDMADAKKRNVHLQNEFLEVQIEYVKLKTQALKRKLQDKYGYGEEDF